MRLIEHALLMLENRGGAVRQAVFDNTSILEEHRPGREFKNASWTVFLLEYQFEARVIGRSKNTRQDSWRVFSRC